jgi:hypothetical protein
MSETGHELRLAVSADLQPAFFERWSKGLDVRIDPERDECRSVCEVPPGFAVDEHPPLAQVVDASADGAKGDISLFSDRSVRSIEQIGPDQKRHYGLDPRLVRTPRRSHRILGGPAAFDVYEQPGRLKVRIARQIDVVDTSSLEHGRVLRPDVRREEEQSVGCVFWWQSRATAQHLIGDHRGVLETQVPLLLNQVSPCTVTGVEGEDAIELALLGCLTELALRHPRLEERTVWLQLTLRPRHVRQNIMFINNEQGY